MRPTKWTENAIDCYNIGCWCSKCHLVPVDFRRKCKMKKTVIELVKAFGKPSLSDTAIKENILSTKLSTKSNRE